MRGVLDEIRDTARLDERNPTPLYLQLRRCLHDLIGNGTLQQHEALPSERDIADGLGISRVTVRKAIGNLVEEGLLTQRRGSGTFIAARPRVALQLSRLSSFTDDMRARGLRPGAETLLTGVGPATPEEVMALGLSPGEAVSRLHRLRTADGVRLAIERASVPARHLPDPAALDGSLYELLRARGLLPERALQQLKAVSLDAEQAALLGVPAGSAALYIERRGFLAGGAPIEFTRSHYRGDAYDFVAELHTGTERAGA